MKNPYVGRPRSAFWESGVAKASSPVPEDFYRPKWEIPKTARIVTAGSCFAQHIGRRLSASGFAIVDAEPAPELLPAEHRQAFHYGVYSARYGNIYTARQLRQLVDEALDGPVRHIIWKAGDGYVDALRPQIEPEPLATAELVRIHRERHIERVRLMLENADLLIFTFGLTEAWEDVETGSVLPIVPGTRAGGSFDPDRYAFHNFTHAQVMEDFLAVYERLLSLRPDIRFLVTVSPVPLVATAIDRHVQVSTIYSKSVLRAVAGELSDRYENIDYFPSYEIITSPWSGSCFYGPDMREVTVEGVSNVMQTFMSARGEIFSAASTSETALISVAADEADDMAVVCEEELLEAFGR
ncbi:MAG: GSCFA domain-containing protein [Parvibaculum sp.]